MAGLYIHIPYCHSKCAYCDFYSRPDDGNINRLAETIVQEFDIRSSELNETIDTIYIGGGTPSILSDTPLSIIIKGIRPSTPLKEFTIEANPEDITRDKLAIWQSLGIDRVSMGVQSLCDSELMAVKRRHNAATALAAIRNIQNAGFSKLSCDLIYGLPEQTADSWRDSLRRLLDTGIGHLSAYSLSLEPGTLLYTRMMQGKLRPADDDMVVELYNILISTAAEYGFQHYEISNFAKPGHRAVHNSAYWTSVPYLGLGPAAHSFDGCVRRVNPSSIKKYLEKVPSFEIDAESEIDRINDMIITSLRTDAGLNLDILPADLRKKAERSARKWVNRSMLEFRNNNLVIPERHWIMADAIMRDMLIV